MDPQRRTDDRHGRGQRAGRVDDQQVAGAQQVRQVGEAVVGDGGSLPDEQSHTVTGGSSRLGRLVRLQLRRQHEIQPPNTEPPSTKPPPSSRPPSSASGSASGTDSADSGSDGDRPMWSIARSSAVTAAPAPTPVVR
ncbi:hypothetical protein GCM10027610_140210 [Dactylosporangium cerinum]